MLDGGADPGASTTAGDGKINWPELGFPDDWRDRASGGDDKVGGLLKRFTSMQNVAKALFNARQQLSEGRKSSLPENATPEQLATYRKENGVPDKPEAYLENLPSGLVIGEADKPLVAQFAKDMHDLHQPPAVVHAAIQSYYRIQEQQASAMRDANETARNEGMDALRTEWGGEFKGNLNAISGMLSTIPEDARNAIMSARDSTGLLLFNQPGVVKAFAQLARELNPAATVVPNHGGDPGKAIGDEIKEIEKIMGSEAYWKDTAKQARYRELVAARDRLPTRAA